MEPIKCIVHPDMAEIMRSVGVPDDAIIEVREVRPIAGGRRTLFDKVQAVLPDQVLEVGVIEPFRFVQSPALRVDDIRYKGPRQFDLARFAPAEPKQSRLARALAEVYPP